LNKEIFKSTRHENVGTAGLWRGFLSSEAPLVILKMSKLKTECYFFRPLAMCTKKGVFLHFEAEVYKKDCFLTLRG